MRQSAPRCAKVGHATPADAPRTLGPRAGAARRHRPAYEVRARPRKERVSRIRESISMDRMGSSFQRPLEPRERGRAMRWARGVGHPVRCKGVPREQRAARVCDISLFRRSAYRRYPARALASTDTT